MKRSVALIGMVALIILAATVFAPAVAQAADKSTTQTRGVIKAKKKGKCKIYVYAQNGAYKTVTITVK